MSILTSGRLEPCKDNAGGIKGLYLCSFIPYSALSIEGYKNMLITTFPTTLVFEYKGVNKRVTEKLIQETGYEQTITIDLFKQDYLSAVLLDDLMKKKVRVIVIDRLENIRVYGLHNGLDVEVSATSGGVRSDFAGYSLTISGGAEPFAAPYLPSLPGSGFVTEGVTLDCLLCSSDQPASLQDEIASCSIVV